MEDKKIIRYYNTKQYPTLHRDIEECGCVNVMDIREVVLESLGDVTIFDSFRLMRNKRYQKGFWGVVNEEGYREILYPHLLDAIKAKGRLIRKERIDTEVCGVLEIKALNVVREPRNIEVLV